LNNRAAEFIPQQGQFRCNTLLLPWPGEAGIPRDDDFQGAAQYGAGHYQATARNGRR
jgi:hypothetical protein